ncbi:hypothetical protein BGW80DRAFT_1340587 [Lactifluus volemus]|nr:hypothetical protein BGW80DRAFT_1340587 [Lactifluus volemus]
MPTSIPRVLSSHDNPANPSPIYRAIDITPQTSQPVATPQTSQPAATFLPSHGPIPAHVESLGATSPNLPTAAAIQPDIPSIPPLATSELANPFFPDPQPSFPQSSSSSHLWRLSGPPDSSSERSQSRTSDII